MEMEKIRKL